MNSVTLGVFFAILAAVAILGFSASRWRQPETHQLDEWGLGGRSFGTIVSWFLLGGELYTAYVFIAIPALIFTSGAIGFYALPYTTLVYPLIAFLVMPRLWLVAKRHGYVTGADFAKGRFGSRNLALAIAITGLLYTLPAIALQLLGIQIVFEQLGLAGASGWSRDVPLLLAFGVLAAYTYRAGLRAAALTAFMKDGLIYITILVAVVYLPAQFGGWGNVFDIAGEVLPTRPAPGSVILPEASFLAYVTLAVGSMLGLFLSPFAMTAVLASRSRNTIRRNAAMMPLYTLVLGFLALLGFVAVAAEIEVSSPNLVLPELFTQYFSSWFAGVALAAIAVAALVPASVMSISAANLFTRNIYGEYIRPGMTGVQETTVAKLSSLAVKFGAVAFVILFQGRSAVIFSLLGVVWLLQTLPTIFGGLYTRWFHSWALLAGWAVGMVGGTLMLTSQDFALTYPLSVGSHTFNAYAGLYALALNLAVVVVMTVLLRRWRDDRFDETSPEDYLEQPRIVSNSVVSS